MAEIYMLFAGPYKTLWHPNTLPGRGNVGESSAHRPPERDDAEQQKHLFSKKMIKYSLMSITF